MLLKLTEKEPEYLTKQKECYKKFRREKRKILQKEIDDSKYFEPEGLPI